MKTRSPRARSAVSARRAAALSVGWGSATVVAVILGGLLIGGPASGAPVGPDRMLHDLLFESRSRWLNTVALILDTVGGTVVSYLVAVVISLAFGMRRCWAEGIRILATVIITSWSATLIKALIGRDRPEDALLTLSSAAYPSGHAAMTAAIVTSAALAIAGRSSPHRVLLWSAASVWVVAVSLSRVYLGVHWWMLSPVPRWDRGSQWSCSGY